MVTEFVLDWNTAFYFIIPCIYILLVKILSQKQTRPPVVSDEEYITTMARMGGCSEYDIFIMACEAWHIPKSRTEDDFKAYLKSGQLPYYVKDYVRKVKEL